MCKDVCGALFKIATQKNGKNLGVIYTQWDAMQVIYLMSLSPNPPFHILLCCWAQDSTYSTSQTPGPAGFLLGSGNGRNSRKSGRQDEKRRDWVPVSPFPASSTPAAAAVGSNLHFLSALPNPASSDSSKVPAAAGDTPPSKVWVPQNPRSELLGSSFSTSFLSFL